MRALVISDIHGNSDALNEVLKHAGSWDYLWVLGDLVDYGPEPHIVVDVIRDLRPDIIVMGNHDYAVAFNDDCRCAPELHDLSKYTRTRISYRLLSKEQISWLSTLPKNVSSLVGGLRLYLTHGSPRNPLYGYLKLSTSINELKLALTPNLTAVRPEPLDADIVLVGHTHIPMDITVDSIRVLNPGSVGQPRDGDPRASYMVIELSTWEVKVFRVKYDIMKVINKLKGLDLHEKYLNLLERILINGKVPP